MPETDSDSWEEEKEGSEFGGFAYSLFDDFKSYEASEVYEHMEREFGFKYNLLGNSTLHRVALLKYLQEKKDNNENVLEAYNYLKENKNVVLDRFEEFIKPPFKNEKLIWGFMESTDSEAEEELLSNYVQEYPVKGDPKKMSENNEGIDNLLLLLTQRSGGVENLLENFFTFLARKTDFYRPPDKTDESSLDHCVNLVSYHCRKAGLKYSDLINRKLSSKKSSISSFGNAHCRIPKSTSVLSAENDSPKEFPKSSTKVSKSVSNDFLGRTESSSSVKSDNSRSSLRSFTSRFKFSKEASSESTFPYKEEPHSRSDSFSKVSSYEEPQVKKEVAKEHKPESEDTESEADSSPPPGNGGKTEWYEWTQTLGSLEVVVRLPEGTLSQNIKVDITTNSLSVKINKSLLFGGTLFDHVKSDECLWAVVDNSSLQISLEKRNRMNWWPTVIKGHPEIDVKKIVPENSKLSDLDPETRSTVEKMMFDQRQKAAGLPTSSQQSQYEALERFKKAHPELDFSKANINFG